MPGNKKNIIVLAGAGVIAVMAVVIYLVLFTGSSAPAEQISQGTPQFGMGEARGSTSAAVPDTTGNVPVSVALDTSTKVFKISDGPVAGATLVDTTQPTSTVARFVMQDNGHVFDLTLDSPGEMPKVVSNTTIPGIDRVVWSERGRGALLQYLERNAVKTVHLALPATGSTTPAVRLQFLPQGVNDLAVSPDGGEIAYLVRGTGTDGYRAAADGSGAKKLFSLPLAQTLVSWPAPDTLLVSSASASGVPGVAYAVDAKSGSATPVLFSDGLTVSGNGLLSKILFQKVEADARATYVYDVRTGLSVPLSLDPAPERCLWSLAATSTVYCAAPLTYVAPNYLDLWHQGASSAADALISYDASSGATKILATPGSADGGEETNVAELSASPRAHYLLFIRKGDRSLWGVKL